MRCEYGYYEVISKLIAVELMSRLLGLTLRGAAQ